MKYNLKKKSNLKSYLGSCAGVLALSIVSASLNTSAFAQDANEEVDEVIVTGSRIATDSTLTAPSPVQTVTIDDFRNSGDIEIATSLRNIPALQGSDPATLDSAQGFAATGVSTLNLRNLGTARTLVLQGRTASCTRR